MKNIALGRYIPYNSIIHRLDPRIKLLGMVLFFVSVFLPNLNLESYLLLIAILIALVKVSHLKIKSQLRTLKAMWVMLFFLLIINIFIRKTGDVIVNINGFTIYSDAIIYTLELVVRMFLLISVSTILTATTKPLDLTNALEFYMRPLRVVKFPSHEIAMIISLALRFIPTILEEAQRIMKAQISRGVDLDHGKFKEKIIGIVSMIFPLFISAFERSDELANAMESRGYNPSGKRTRYYQLQVHYRDFIALGICICIVVGIYFFKQVSLIPIQDIRGMIFNV